MSRNFRIVGAICTALALGWPSALALDKESVKVENLPLKEKLARPVDVHFRAAPLSEVVEFFRTTLAINVVMDGSALKLEDKPITLELKDVHAADALTLSLRQADLRYVIVNGGVFVGDRKSVAGMEPLYFRQYDVGDLTQ